MPAKRKNTPRGVARKQTNSKKKTTLSLNLVLKQLDKFDQRFDALDRRIDALDQKADQRFDALDRRIDVVDRKVDAVRQETAAEFKAVRDEMAQGFTAVRQETAAEFKAVRDEMAQGFARMEQQISAENQAVRADLVKHYSQLDRKIDAQAEHYQQSHNQLLTSMDSAARSYEEYWRDKKLSDNMLRELREEVEELRKRDMEKAAAIEKIEKQIKAA